jgi:hypothetical protein
MICALERIVSMDGCYIFGSPFLAFFAGLGVSVFVLAAWIWKDLKKYERESQ